MSAIATAIVGGAVIGGVLNQSAASSAADAQVQASKQASDAQLQMYNQTRSDQAPYRYVGGEALNSLAAAMGLNGYSGDTGGGGYGGGGYGGGGRMAMNDLYGARIGNGIAGGGPFNNRMLQTSAGPGKSGGPNTAGFMASPGYNFVRSEGMRGLEQSAAARGGAFSGNALRALADYNNGLASQEYGNWWNRMAGLAGVGQTSTNQLGQLGQGYANNIGNAAMSAGNARASGIMGAANGWANSINSGINNYMMYNAMNNAAGTAAPYIAPTLSPVASYGIGG